MSERAVIVGKRVKAMRMQKGISQSELSPQSGDKPSPYEQYRKWAQQYYFRKPFCLTRYIGRFHGQLFCGY